MLISCQISYICPIGKEVMAHNLTGPSVEYAIYNV